MIQLEPEFLDDQVIYCLAGQLREAGVEVDADIPDGRLAETTAGAVRAAQGQSPKRHNKLKKDKAPTITKPEGPRKDDTNEDPGTTSDVS